ncbi:unnamed protein product [Ixodes hexagonus]
MVTELPTNVTSRPRPHSSPRARTHARTGGRASHSGAEELSPSISRARSRRQRVRCQPVRR